MFKKNNFLKLEILPDGRELITSNLNDDGNATKLAELINRFLTRDDLVRIFDQLLKNAKKKKIESVAMEVCESIISVQTGIKLVPIRSGRNPIIRPTQVMKNFLSQNEEE